MLLNTRELVTFYQGVRSLWPIAVPGKIAYWRCRCMAVKPVKPNLIMLDSLETLIEAAE